MRLIKFTKATIPAGYPAEFKNVSYYAGLDLFIGYYSGALPLDDYTGAWPLDPQETKAIYTIENQVIKLNTVVAAPFSGSYYCEPNDAVELTCDISDGAGIVTGLTIPVTLKMPLVRHANGNPTDDEIYLNVTITAGVMIATGVLPWSGDWKIIIDRVNQSIDRIGATWKIQADDITFLA